MFDNDKQASSFIQQMQELGFKFLYQALVFFGSETPVRDVMLIRSFTYSLSNYKQSETEIFVFLRESDAMLVTLQLHSFVFKNETKCIRYCQLEISGHGDWVEDSDNRLESLGITVGWMSNGGSRSDELLQRAFGLNEVPDCLARDIKAIADSFFIRGYHPPTKKLYLFNLDGSELYKDPEVPVRFWSSFPAEDVTMATTIYQVKKFKTVKTDV